MPLNREPKILLLDIESLPDMSQVMKHFTGLSAYPGLTFKASLSSVICFGYKWLGDKKASCLNAWDYPAWKKNINDDSQLLKDIHKIICEADVLVSHNGISFDHKFIQTRLLHHRMSALPKIIHIDTRNEARKNLLLFNNRLQTVAQFLTSEEKLENGGWSLWEGVQKKDPKCMALMTKYCKQDVQTLEAVFKVLRPFTNKIPSYKILQNINSDGKLCPNCGSSYLIGHGTRASKGGLLQRFFCGDCGTTSSQPKKPNKPLETY